MVQMLPMKLPYVSFETLAVEKQKPKEEGGYVFTEFEDFVKITPSGSKDVTIRAVKDWFAYLEMQVSMEMMPAEALERYKSQYEAFKQKKEIPLSGTPIKGWPLATEAQRAKCLEINLHTVEDLANANSEALQRLGMGGMALKERANSFLQAQNSHAPLVGRMEAMESQLKALLEQNKKLLEENTILSRVHQIAGVAPGNPPNAPAQAATLQIPMPIPAGPSEDALIEDGIAESLS